MRRIGDPDAWRTLDSFAVHNRFPGMGLHRSGLSESVVILQLSVPGRWSPVPLLFHFFFPLGSASLYMRIEYLASFWPKVFLLTFVPRPVILLVRALLRQLFAGAVGPLDHDAVKHLLHVFAPAVQVFLAQRRFAFITVPGSAEPVHCWVPGLSRLRFGSLPLLIRCFWQFPRGCLFLPCEESSLGGWRPAGGLHPAPVR